MNDGVIILENIRKIVFYPAWGINYFKIRTLWKQRDIKHVNHCVDGFGTCRYLIVFSSLLIEWIAISASLLVGRGTIHFSNVNFLCSSALVALWFRRMANVHECTSYVTNLAINFRRRRLIGRLISGPIVLATKITSRQDIISRISEPRMMESINFAGELN